jgi:TRAP-type mannitol/chloroaromatic compound transport system permease small subunit
VGLTLLITWEVFSRYALDRPHAWAFDVMIMMYGTLFMRAGAYTLAKNSHARRRALWFFRRGYRRGSTSRCTSFSSSRIIAFVWAGYTYAAESWRSMSIRTSLRGPAGLPVQDGHPDRRGADPHSRHRRNHPLHHLPEAGRVAVARGGRGRG